MLIKGSDNILSKILSISKTVVIVFITLAILGTSLFASGSLLLNFNICKLTLNKLPIYTLTQEPSADREFAKSLLKSDDKTFVCDYYEWPLEAIKRDNNIIGRTEDGGRLYQIIGQDNLDYILFSGSEEMSIPLVFRRSDIVPKEIFFIPISKVSFNGVSTGVVDSDNTSLINEILNRIKENKFITLKTTDKFDSYNLTLYSSDFEGIGYRLYAVITPNKEVFLMDSLLDSVDYEVIPAGTILSDWILKHING